MSPAADRPEPLVSVIAPAYNEEKYIAECVESILAQTYDNWQLTIVNNQSTDGTLAIAEQYARRDPRIRVITTPEFYSQMRNHSFAMRQISPQSKYCKVVLADTWIFPDCLRLMVDAAEANPRIGVVSALWMTSNRIVANTLPYPSLLIPGRAICRRQLLADEDYFGSPTMLLFRSEVVRARDPFFRDGARSGDVEACYETLADWDFAFVHQLLSFNRTDNISISSPARQFADFSLNQLIHLFRYGRQFLDAEEYAGARRRLEKLYYGFLAGRALQFPGKAFWDYHRDALATVDRRLSSWLLAKHVLLECADAVFNPMKTAGRLLRWSRARRQQAAAGTGTGRY